MRVGLKNHISHYGYKNSICNDAEYDFIRRFLITPANIHDSQILLMVFDPENQDDYLWGAFENSGERIKELISLARFGNRIHEKG